VDEIDPRSETGKIHGLLHGGIAATDDGDFQTFKKSGIAYGTIGYAKTGILALTGAPLPAKTRTAGDDDGPGRDPAAVLEMTLSSPQQDSFCTEPVMNRGAKLRACARSASAREAPVASGRPG